MKMVSKMVSLPIINVLNLEVGETFSFLLSNISKQSTVL